MRRPSLKGLSVLLAPCANSPLTAQNLISTAKEKSSSAVKIVSAFLQISLLVIIAGVSQAQDMEGIVSDYFKEVTAEKYPSTPRQFSDPDNAETTLLLLKPYFKDSLPMVRAKAYEITHQAASQSSIHAVRQQGVDILIRACTDSDFGNMGMALSYLKEYRKEDYTTTTKDSVRNLFRKPSAHFDQLIKLAGYLHLTDLKKEIQPYTQPGNSTKIRWAAILSLARMGESSAIQEMMKRVTKLPVNDDVVYRIFPDMVYTRQPEAIAYLLEALNSNARNCMSADAEKETPIVCGYRIMEQLAPVIEDFPLRLGESGDIITHDYPAALTTVRHWFETHKTFTIRNDKY